MYLVYNITKYIIYSMNLKKDSFLIFRTGGRNSLDLPLNIPILFSNAATCNFMPLLCIYHVDPSRFRLTHETSFVRQHATFWTKMPIFFYIVRPTLLIRMLFHSFNFSCLFGETFNHLFHLLQISELLL
jgi:hypothetical protein